jgi:hypothetical protein
MEMTKEIIPSLVTLVSLSRIPLISLGCQDRKIGSDKADRRY